jgi:hypothetical protein
MSTNGLNRNTQLLSDAPASEDAFEGGHNRVAEALAGLIQDEEGGKAVALKGPFGSGKSTVVRLLENELEEVDEEEGEDTRIFTYDAWEHQGDPLRRSFIESLVEFLRDPEHGWAGEYAWQDEIDRIARRKEVTTVDTKPVLTGWGRAIAITAFIAPLGVFIVNNFIRSDWGGIQLESPEVGLWIFGVFLFLLPVILALIALVKSDQDESFYVFVQESRQEEETKTIKTPDPTSIEFQQTFHKILCQSLRGSNRQLIIVVDNLDRLPPEQALSTWATMRTFFETEGANEDEWMDRFWLLVPLNFEALRGVFTSDEKRLNSEGVDSGQEDKSEWRDGERNEIDSVEAFANKTFSTVFRVAPPVLSDWEQFMKDQLREAFQAEESEDFHAVYRLYRIAGVGHDAIPTPRDIKIFINRLSGLYRQWGGEISLPILAAYQLKSDEISQDGEDLTGSGFLRSRVEAELRNGDWQKHFAALHFNVQPDKATQVLIGERVQTALETGNEEEDLGELSEVAGFSNVVDRSVPRIVGRMDSSSILLSSLALDTVSLDDKDVERTAWRKLRNGLRRVEDWYPKEKREGKGLLNIVRRAPEHRQEDLLKDILAELSQVEIQTSVQEFPNTGTQWAESVLPLVRAFESREELLHENFHVPNGWPTYIGVISHIAQQQDAKTLAPFFVPADDIGTEGIDEAVEEIVSADAVKPYHLGGIKLLPYIDLFEDIDWGKTSDALQNRLTLNNSVSDEELRMHLKMVLVIAAFHGFKPLKDAIGGDPGRSHLSHHLQAYQTKDKEIVALCVLLRILYSAEKNRGSNPGNANRGHNQFINILDSPSEHETVVQAVANLVQEFDIIWSLLFASQQDRAVSFIHEVLRELASKPEASTLIDHDVISEFPNLVFEALQNDRNQLEKLVSEADQNGDLSATLKSFRQDEWVEVLKREDRMLDVVLILTDETELQLSSAFQDALLEHAKSVLDQQSSPGSLWLGEWSELLEALSDPQRTSFLHSLQRTLLAKSDQSLTSVLSVYGDVIVESGVAADVPMSDPTDTVNEHFRPLLQRANLGELRWLASTLDGKPELAEEVDPDIWEAFQERIRECLEGAHEEYKEVFKEIADLASVEIDNFGEEDPENEAVDQAEE